jgi:hypothetical protein
MIRCPGCIYHSKNGGTGDTSKFIPHRIPEDNISVVQISGELKILKLPKTLQAKRFLLRSRPGPIKVPLRTQQPGSIQ